MRVSIVGNSVGFKIRPPRSAVDELTYSEILRERGHDVRNVSKAGVMLCEQFGLLDDDVITSFPDVVVLHHGIVEAFPRQTVRRWNNAGIHNQYRNAVMRHSYRADSLRTRASRAAWRAVNLGTMLFARAMGRRWQWQDTDRFAETVAHACEIILKETAAQIVVVGIAPPQPDFARTVPGLAVAVDAANAALRNVCLARGTRIAYLDAWRAMGGRVHEDVAPDGVHFSALGHRLLAAELIRLIERCDGTA